MKRLITLALALTGLLAIPAAGHASQTFGSLLKNSPAPGPDPCVDTAPGPCTLVGYIHPNDAGDPVTSPAPADGVVVKFRIRSLSAESVTFRFATIDKQGDTAFAQGAGIGPTVTLAGTGEIEEFPARMPVRQGTHTALDAPSTTMVYNTGGNEYTYLYGPPLTEGQGPRAQGAEPTGELLIQAVMEPDADKDGFGDETQDGCPADAAATAPPCNVADTTKPVLSGVQLSPKTFKRSASLGYRLSEAATLTVRVQKAKPGRRVAGRCRRPSPRNATRPRCTRYTRVRGKLTDAGAAGKNALAISRTFAGRRLRPGRYRLVIVAKDGAGNTSAVKRIKFRVTR